MQVIFASEKLRENFRLINFEQNLNSTYRRYRRKTPTDAVRHRLSINYQNLNILSVTFG